MPYKAPVRSSSAVRGAVSEMRRERARHHRGETRQPGDRQPYPRHLMGSARAARFRTAPASRRRSAARRTRARRGAARRGPSRAAAAGRVASAAIAAGQRRHVSRRDEQPGLRPPARPAARSRGIPACRWRRSPARRRRLRAAISAVPRHRSRAAPRSRPRPRPRAHPRPGRATPLRSPGSAASAASARSSSESGLSGSVGPASTSSIASPSCAQQAHRRDRVQHALAAQHAADQRHPDARPARFRDRLRQRREMRRIDPGAADQHQTRPVDPEPGERLAVLRVLHDDAGVAGGMAQSPRQRRAGQPRRPARGGKPGTEPVDGGDAGRPSARRGNARRSAAAAEQYRLQRDMMHDIGPLAPIQRGDRRHGAAGADDTVAAPPPAQRLEPKPLGADPVAMRALARGDDDFEPGIARRPRDRQPVRPEIPILGDQIEQLRPLARPLRRPLDRRFAAQGPVERSVGDCKHTRVPNHLPAAPRDRRRGVADGKKAV